VFESVLREPGKKKERVLCNLDGAQSHSGEGTMKPNRVGGSVGTDGWGKKKKSDELKMMERNFRTDKRREE